VKILFLEKPKKNFIALMAMKIPSLSLGLQCTAGKGLIRMPKNRSKKKDKLIKVCPFLFIK
jgi:hypothetical protein